MNNRRDSGKALRKALTNLDFDTARTLANELAKDVTERVTQQVADEVLKGSEAPAKSLDTLRCILMIAETYFYNGRTSEAHQLLRPFTEKKGALKAFVNATSEIPMRERLQLVEYLYSNNELDKATDLADQLLKTVHKESSEARFEEGEIEYFRVRIANRMANYEAMLNGTMRALSALTDSDHGSPDSDFNSQQMRRVRWRLGQVLLVFGRGAWKYGDPGRGDARLHLAEWFLRGLPDKMSYANVQRALGSMYRAQGGSLDDEAISYRDMARTNLEQARDVYKRLGHTMNCSRVHRSLGILWLSQRVYETAAKEFETAINYAEKENSTRQIATIKVWKSWLAQERENPDYDGAIALGKDALENLNEKEVPAACVDAHLSIGSAYFMKHDLGQAESHFKEGLEIAQTQKLKKHHINVLLSLAHLSERRSDIRQAWDHYRAAMKVVPDGKFPDSRFLRQKKRHVKEALEKYATFNLPFDECIQKNKPLKYWQKELESWLIKQADQREKGKIGNIAKQLGIPRQRVSKLLKEKKR